MYCICSTGFKKFPYLPRQATTFIVVVIWKEGRMVASTRNYPYQDGDYFPLKSGKRFVDPQQQILTRRLPLGRPRLALLFSLYFHMNYYIIRGRSLRKDPLELNSGVRKSKGSEHRGEMLQPMMKLPPERVEGKETHIMSISVY